MKEKNKRRNKKRRRHTLKKIWRLSGINICIILIFLGISIVCLHILQESLLNNTRQMGQALSQSYSLEEERSINGYRILIAYGANSMERELKSGAGNEELSQWLGEFFANIINLTGEGVIDPYAVVDGKIVAATPRDGNADFDPWQADWYKDALAADGDIIFTDTYADSMSGKPVITIAVRCADTDTVLAFDVYPENFHVSSNRMILPDDSSYYLCDRAGRILYAESDLDLSDEELQDYVTGIVKAIEDGSFDHREASITDPDGYHRGVYYNEAANGWLSIVTIPYRTILSDLRWLALVLTAVFLAFLTFTVLISIRQYRLNRNMEKTNETVRVLGNSYYAIYRVNIHDETYDMIKASDDIRLRLEKHGDYDRFIRTAGEVIEKAAFDDFIKSFSLENIRALVKERVRDFGGDFLRRFGQEYRWVSVHMLFDESLSRGEVVLCFKEVGEERKRHYERMELLKNALESAKNSEESQKRFFSTMSHDMRTPLNAIIGLSELAKKHLASPEKLEADLEKINYSSRQLLGLINDILEMSRLEQAGITLDQNCFDLKQCIEAAAGVFCHQAEREKKQYEVKLDIYDRMVMGDAFRLTQVMNNLLSNAFKFTPPGGHISVHVLQLDRLRHSKFQFVVRDDGSGMSPEFLEKLFVPYERETRFGAKNVSGTGLGMPIVKSIVSRMDGEIHVDSRLGAGTCITVTLPLPVVSETEAKHSAADADTEIQSVEVRSAAEASEPQMTEGTTALPSAVEALGPQMTADEAAETLSGAAAPAKAGDAGTPQTGLLAGCKILLAEDNEINMEIAAEMLKDQGALVVQAWNGQEAADLFMKSAPGEFDALLLDMQMPEKNGCEAAREIRALPRWDAKRVPIIAVTANAFAEDIAATTEAGMDAHISKPINFEILYQTLLRLIHG